MFGICLVLTLVLVNLINAVGISVYYYEGNPLTLAPGETKNVEVASLLAAHETEDKEVEIEIIEGNEIASVVEKNMNVLAGSGDKTIKLKISIPDEAIEGTKYKIKIRVNEITVPEGGMVGFTNSKTTSISVLVQKPTEQPLPEKVSTWWIVIGILIVVILIAIIYMAVKGKKNSDEVVEPIKK